MQEILKWYGINKKRYIAGERDEGKAIYLVQVGHMLKGRKGGEAYIHRRKNVEQTQ